MESLIEKIAKERGMEAQNSVNGGGTVLPPPVSHGNNCIGIHWLRISFPKKVLADVSRWCSYVWGDFEKDGFGLWSYDSRLHWSSGVSLNFDADDERSFRVHCNRVTLDCPGQACDELAVNDLLLLIEYSEAIGGKCSRIDIYYDDYNRRVRFDELRKTAEHRDFSGLIDFRVTEAGKLSTIGRTREEVSFGKRGSRGNGKYLRWYNKELESDGEFKCDRWEIEFTQDKANIVFMRLAQCKGSIEIFATLCGSLIAGCITFVHRTGDKNIKRLERYEWWREIVDLLGGEMKIRTERKKDSLTGKIEWVKKSVSPSLACLKKVFVSNDAFFRWLWHVCEDGDGRMNPFTRQIAKEYESTIDYRWGDPLEVCEHEELS